MTSRLVGKGRCFRVTRRRASVDQGERERSAATSSLKDDDFGFYCLRLTFDFVGRERVFDASS